MAKATKKATETKATETKATEMSVLEKMNDRPQFKDVYGKKYIFIDVTKTQKVKSWHIQGDTKEDVKLKFAYVLFDDLTDATLKSLDIEITKEMKEARKEVKAKHKEIREARAAEKTKTKKERKNKKNIIVEKLPEEMSCKECGKKSKVYPYVLIKKFDGNEKEILNYVENYLCRKCDPEFGKWTKRKKNPEIERIPEKNVCVECGKEASVNAYQLMNRFDQDVDKVLEYCNNYRCRKCNPEFGKHSKRKPNPLFNKIPRDLVCKCGFKVKAQVAYLRKKFGEDDAAIVKYVNEYKCRKCNPEFGAWAKRGKQFEVNQEKVEKVEVKTENTES